jgi:hypothetical protein
MRRISMTDRFWAFWGFVPVAKTRFWGQNPWSSRVCADRDLSKSAKAPSLGRRLKSKSFVLCDLNSMG